MSDKLNINYIINNVIFTLDERYEDTIPLSLKKYLYLIVSGMIINYGEEYIKDIYRTVFMINFISDEHKNILNPLVYKNPINNNYMEKEINFNNKNNSFSYNLLYKEIDNSSIKTLEYLTSQINYIMFNRKRKMTIYENIKMKISSLNAKFIFKEEHNINIIENIFNVLQTDEIIKIILRFNVNMINNVLIKDSLFSLEKVDINTYQTEGIDLLANLFKPLYKNDKLKELIDSYDNIDLIKKELDSVLGRNTFKNTYNQLVKIDNLINSNGAMDYYELSNCYVNIRNNIINRYISLKWT